MSDRKTGLPRGITFVEMNEFEDAQVIAALNGRSVDGQTLEVREGRPKLHALAAPTRENRLGLATQRVQTNTRPCPEGL